MAAVGWVLCNGEVLATAEIPATSRARARGLLGRDSVQGVLVLRPCRQVHTVRMRFPIDVAFCASDGRVLRVMTLPPWRMTRIVLRSGFVLEAAAGAFERWGVAVGDALEVRE